MLAPPARKKKANRRRADGNANIRSSKNVRLPRTGWWITDGEDRPLDENGNARYSSRQLNKTGSNEIQPQMVALCWMELMAKPAMQMTLDFDHLLSRFFLPTSD